MNAAPKRIVLLGIGHTNAHVVKQWAIDPIPGCILICISKFPSATYSGMLPGTLGGQFSDDQMRIDLRELTQSAGATLVLAETCSLNLEDGIIHFSDHEPISFDALSIGVGSMPAGWQDHLNSPLFVPIKPMQTFLERLEKHLQDRETKTISIVGGGVASVEIALCLQEKLLKKRHKLTPCERKSTSEMVPRFDFPAIEIFTSSEHVAEGMRKRSILRIEQLLASRSISVHRSHRVTRMSESEIVLDDGRRCLTDCVIWATGATAPEVLSKLGLQTDDRGFIATTQTLQSLTDERIFAVGDSGTVMQKPSPKAGVYAVRQCPILWRNLRALVNGGSMHDFKPQSDFLKLLNTGDGKALLEYRWFTAHARWCWLLKTWIDKRFVNEFQLNSHKKGNLLQNILTRKSWSPYSVGAAIGVLSWFTFLSVDHALGITTAMESTAAITERALVPSISETNSFFEAKSPKIDWGWMLVVGVFIGAFISSKLSGDRIAPTVPPLWAHRFGPSTKKRFLGAFFGGLLMLLGARLAGGCTSGHGISGSLQLAASSWLFVIAAFSAGIFTSFMLFGREGRSHV